MDIGMALTNWTDSIESEHGEVFTRRWVVEFILDLVGYTSDKDLAGLRIVEPSCGSGAFVSVIVERLIESVQGHGRDFADAGNSISAGDLLPHNVDMTKKSVEAALSDAGVDLKTARSLAKAWVSRDDFLLSQPDDQLADFVVGNPPYIRLEDVPDDINNAYRSTWPTMRGRSDIYIGFFEKGLSLLKAEGHLGFICADRWMRNQYGGQLRKLVSDHYAVDNLIVMHDVDAFENQVSAYPAITVLRNGKQGPVKLVDTTEKFGESDSAVLSKWATSPRRKAPASKRFTASKLPTWFKGAGLWPAGTPRQLELLADLEARFPPLESSETGTKVGIGVATGCDEVFLRTDKPDVERDRLLPMLTAADIASGTAEWSGTTMVNPWDDDGLVDLAKHPRLAAYLESNGDRVRGRHVARKNPKAWYRTIDRVTPGLRERPKLLLPDMKAAAHPVLDPGGFYPHHNLYYVVSDVWDLEVLGGLLLSDFANLFVGAYCVKMRGGTYRFQAQYLRKIRLPEPDSLCTNLEKQLVKSFRQRDRLAATRAATDAYGIAASPT